MSFQNLLVEIEGAIGVVTINRPDKLNALNRRTLEELSSLLSDLQADENIKGILLTGSGEKAFVAGADLKEIKDLNGESAIRFARFGQELFDRIENFPKPVIALVNGFALGGGCELAMACHIRIASENARFGQPEINLGIIPGYGGTQRLARLIGKGRALEILLTGDMIDARRALEIGLVNRVVPAEKLMDQGKALLGKIIDKGAIAVQSIFQAVNQGLNQTLDQGLHLEAFLFGRVCATKDKDEGISAFFEKRKPQFKGH
ncbi:MAG: enoyl-CoA hydratase [Calditrichaeota bacterium]|nr:enoyl-CoA hydratase [Calditrichota bacterium]